MLRAWENRGDTVVVDEPLYAYYLTCKNVDDPGRDEVLATRSADWREVVRRLTHDPLPPGPTVFYQKHMAQHVLPEVDLAAFRGLRHAFLIRHPAEMLASYHAVQLRPTVEELGLHRQVELYRTFGGPVVDSGDLVRAPRLVLESLCAALGVPFDDGMLSWPAGRRETDGVWGRYWYRSVWESTGFQQPRTADRPLPPELRALLDECLPLYEEMRHGRLHVGPDTTPDGAFAGAGGSAVTR
ncbi:HAD family hydrolase [Micromonospora echinospora]